MLVYVLRPATAFNQPLEDWNVGQVTTMYNMFDSATALSNCNKRDIHSSFEA